MKHRLLDALAFDPIKPLLEFRDPAIALFTKRDLLGQDVSVTDLWELPAAEGIVRRQRPSGSWSYSKQNAGARAPEQYDQLETYRQLGILVEQYGFNHSHSAIRRAASFLLSSQSDDGDIRGIYGSQYSPNYSAGISELLIKAGYANDARVKRIIKWLVAIRQTDGGWALPFRTRGHGIEAIHDQRKTLQPDFAQPSSHMVTGVVLRAFAAHPTYRKSKEASRAARLLLASLFKVDRYADRASAEYWLRFSFPFWYTDLISALDSLSMIGVSKTEPQVRRALDWLIRKQRKGGLWKLKILKGRNKDALQVWLSLAICRILMRLSDRV